MSRRELSLLSGSRCQGILALVHTKWEAAFLKDHNAMATASRGQATLELGFNGS